MKRISRKMKFAAALGMVAVPIAAVWLVGAVQSGVFIAHLARNHRVVASDLLGLGDTIVPVDDDYRLPNQEKMVLGLMDHLGIALVYWQQMFLAATSLRPRWSRR